MLNKRLYLDIHVLQTVPPSCVNRDDTGTPKTAIYGGTMRARVSSQAWKRAVRLQFMKDLASEQVGIRTKNLPDLLAAEIAKLDPQADGQKQAREILKNAGIGVNEKENKADALFFISPAQLKALAEASVAHEQDKKRLKSLLNGAPSLDVALFGRMVASNPELNVDASCQVAHAVSTHAVQTEYDYFTAVDDCSPEDNKGAGHLGTVEFNSATLYRYATVNLCELAQTMESQTMDAVAEFADAFIHAMPTGKQNTFANRTVPGFVYVALRTDQPVNLVGAFENAIPAGPEGYMERSIKRLKDYADRVYQNLADAPKSAWFCTLDDLQWEGAVRTTDKALIQSIRELSEVAE